MRQTPSSRRRLKAIGQRENRWMQNVNHCVSKALVEQNPRHTLFVLEELSGVRNATERVRSELLGIKIPSIQPDSVYGIGRGGRFTRPYSYP